MLCLRLQHNAGKNKLNFLRYTGQCKLQEIKIVMGDLNAKWSKKGDMKTICKFEKGIHKKRIE